MSPKILLSLFDGISCGREAVRQCGVPSSQIRYFASEIDPNAIRVAQHRFPDTVQIGDVKQVRYRNGTLHSENGNHRIGRVFLLLAGSPCQGFSSNGEKKLFDDPRSALYFDFERILRETSPRYFLLENVAMPKHIEEHITKRLAPYGARLHRLNSNNWSAQNRPRLYWTNLPLDVVVHRRGGARSGRANHTTCIIHHPVTARAHTSRKRRRIHTSPLTMRAIVGKHYEGMHHRGHGYYKGGFHPNQEKGSCITRSGWLGSFFVQENGVRRKFTAEECEQMQTLPIGYTSRAGSDNARVALIGNAWTVSVIRELLSGVIA